MRRHLARDARAARLAVADRVERLPRAHVRDVHDAARQLGERDVAQRHDRLGLAGNAAQPERRRVKALVRDAVALERLLFAVLDHRHVEHAGIFERAAHQQRRRHRPPIVGERHAAGLPQLGDVGELLARPGRATRRRSDRRAPGWRRPPSRGCTPVTPALSFTGFVFGMHATAVKPPATAAAVPVATVSLCSCPGSRRWTCMSISPGHTMSPLGMSTTAESASTGRSARRARCGRRRRARRDTRRGRWPDRPRARLSAAAGSPPSFSHPSPS